MSRRLGIVHGAGSAAATTALALPAPNAFREVTISQIHDTYSSVTAPAEVTALLEILALPGGASLQLEAENTAPLPVVVAQPQPHEALTLDLTAIREVVDALGQGAPFRLLGQTDRQRLRTPPLRLTEWHVVDDRLIARCAIPASLEVLQRREAYRARLRLGMQAGAILGEDGATPSVWGDLRDLSLEGCLLELPMEAVRLLASPHPLTITLCFPDGSRCALQATACHHRVDADRQLVSAGFCFEVHDGESQRRIWFFMREIDREARRQASPESAMPPSRLFQASSGETPVGRRSERRYATPMARRLARVAGYLDVQLLALKEHQPLDSAQLSHHTDRLLTLHDEDRQALLFATRCLHDEPLLVRHGLGVAVHLLDLATQYAMPQPVRKALVACALVHDLGKGLLPEALLGTRGIDAAGRAELQTHVARLMPQLAACRWLMPSVVEAVVGGINERLDGSGYPAGLTGEQLGELARLAAVVDALEAMRRDRADRPAWCVADAYRDLLGQPQRFDQRWVRRYIRRFGLYPIGALVRFAGGELGWIQRLDGDGRPAQVQLAMAIEPPGKALGAVLSGARLAALGAPVEELPVAV